MTYNLADDASVDFETASPVDLRKTGVYPYAEHPDTRVWCMAWRTPDADGLWFPGQPFPFALAEHIAAGGRMRAWNAQFERVIWNTLCVPRFGWPEVPIVQWVCTAAEAAAMALPRKLEDAGKVLGTIEQKDLDGHKLMMKMAKPRKRKKSDGPGDDLLWHDSAENIARLGAYCVQDVATEMAVAKRINRLTPGEQKAYALDQRINDRGVTVDSALVWALEQMASQAMAEINESLAEVTGGAVTAVTQRNALLGWLKDMGVEVDKLDKAVVEELLNTDELPEDVKEALELRRDGGKSSVAKVRAMQRCACRDGRIRGLLLFLGAATGRWAGRLVQVQNLPARTKGIRSDFGSDRKDAYDPELLIPAILEHSFGLVDALLPAMEVAALTLRACLVAAPGKKLIAADFSAIEARVLAWLAGEKYLIEAFRKGDDVYKIMASAIYKVPVAQVSKAQRQVGKMVILGCGYGMGWKKFVASCALQGVTLDGQFGRFIVDTYRQTNARIKAWWGELEEAAIEAVRNPGEVFRVSDGRIKFTCRNGFLYIVLPARRALAYFSPRIVQQQTPWGELRDAVQFFGQKTTTKSRVWRLIDLYGGLLAENIVQAVSRDVMLHAMWNAEEAGYATVFTVHDELVTECDENVGSPAELEALMCDLPDWADGLPIAAEGWSGPRYKK